MLSWASPTQGASQVIHTYICLAARARTIRSPPALGTFSTRVDRLVPDGMPAGINLGWQFVGATTVLDIEATPSAIPLEIVLPTKDIAAPTLPLGRTTSMCHYLTPAAAKKHSTRGIAKPRTKLSRRMAATLSLFTNHVNSSRSKSAAVATTKRPRDAGIPGR